MTHHPSRRLPCRSCEKKRNRCCRIRRQCFCPHDLLCGEKRNRCCHIRCRLYLRSQLCFGKRNRCCRIRRQCFCPHYLPCEKKRSRYHALRQTRLSIQFFLGKRSRYCRIQLLDFSHVHRNPCLLRSILADSDKRLLPAASGEAPRQEAKRLQEARNNKNIHP